MWDTGDKGPHRTGKSILSTQVKMVWQLPSKTHRKCGDVGIDRKHSCFPWRRNFSSDCTLSRKGYPKSVSFSLSLCLSTTIPPLPSLLEGASYLIGGNAQSWISLVLCLPWGTFLNEILLGHSFSCILLLLLLPSSCFVLSYLYCPSLGKDGVPLNSFFMW